MGTRNLGARGFRLPHSLNIDIDSVKSLHFPLISIPLSHYLKEFQQKNSPAVPSRWRKRKKRNNSSRETATSDGCQAPCHSAADGHKEGPAPCATAKDPESPYQLQIALDSSSITSSELNNTTKLLPSSCCEAVLEQQLQQFLQERELLKAQVAEVTECLKKAQLERDAYAEQLKTERAQWQQEMLKMIGEGPLPLCFGQIDIFKMEKIQDTIKIEELKGSIAHLQNHLAEPPIPKLPAGTSDLEQNLKTETKYLRDELLERERLQEAKMRLQEQEVRLREQEERLLEQEGLQEQEEELTKENRSAVHLEQEVKELQEKLDEQETVTSAPSRRAGRQAPASGEGRCKAKGSSTLGAEAGSPGLLPGVDIIIPARGMEPPGIGQETVVYVPFLKAAGAGAQEEQAWLCEQLQKQQVCCQHLAHPVASALKEPESAAAASGTGSESGCGETQRALQEADKLQRDFMAIVKENADLKEQVENLELGFTQLSGERDMMSEQEAGAGQSIKPPEDQRAVAKTQHREEEYVSVIIQEEEGTRVRHATSLRGARGVGVGRSVGAGTSVAAEHPSLQVKLPEMLEPVFQLMIDEEWEHQNRANEPTPGSSAPQELSAANQQGEFYEVSLDDDSNSLEPAGGEGAPQHPCTAFGAWLYSCGKACNTSPWGAVHLYRAFIRRCEERQLTHDSGAN
ncbi:Golgin subfamily A member 2 [Plecturocebus cupreus]